MTSLRRKDVMVAATEASAMCADTLDDEQQRRCIMAASLAIAAGQRLLDMADRGALELAPVVDRLFRALALLGTSFPTNPAWGDPDRRAGNPNVARAPH